MRGFGLLLVVCAGCLLAQSPVSPEVDKAKEDIARLRTLVEAGAAPRVQLEKAEAELADAEDAALLRRTLYGQDLTVDLADDMLAAAHRRRERREKSIEDAKKLVALGVAPESSLRDVESELESVK